MGEGPFLWVYADLRGGWVSQNDPKPPLTIALSPPSVGFVSLNGYGSAKRGQ